jgi:hypothetical protein
MCADCRVIEDDPMAEPHPLLQIRSQETGADGGMVEKWLCVDAKCLTNWQRTEDGRFEVV